MASPGINKYHDSSSRSAIVVPREVPGAVGIREELEMRALAAGMSKFGSKEELETNKFKLLKNYTKFLQVMVVWEYGLMTAVIIFPGLGLLDIPLYVQISLIAGVTGVSALRIVRKVISSLANTTLDNQVR